VDGVRRLEHLTRSLTVLEIGGSSPWQLYMEGCDRGDESGLDLPPEVTPSVSPCTDSPGGDPQYRFSRPLRLKKPCSFGCKASSICTTTSHPTTSVILAPGG